MKEDDALLGLIFDESRGNKPLIAALLATLVVEDVIRPAALTAIFARARGFIENLQDHPERYSGHLEETASLVRSMLAEHGHENLPPRPVHPPG